jgi:hypothetical protein
VSAPASSPPFSTRTPAGAPPPQPIPADACPLCGAPLAADQEWCLNCGAAARTRLAATPGWHGPVAVVAVITALALGILAAALVKLAGDSGPAPAPATTTVTSAAAAPPATVPTPATTPTVGVTPTTAAPGATTTQTGAAQGQTTAPTAPNFGLSTKTLSKLRTTKAGQGRLRSLAPQK